MRDDVTADADGVELVDGEVVAQTGDPGVHVGAAERLVVGVLAGGHLHQRRAAEEHLGLLVDQHGVVAHPGHVGPARGGVAEHQRDAGDPHRRQLGEFVKDPAGGNEKLGLRGQVRAAGLDQVHHRQPVDPRDLQRPQVLAQRVGIHRAAAHRGVVGDDHALGSRHHADAGDDRGADVELGAPGGQRGQFHERRVAVDQELDAFARQ